MIGVAVGMGILALCVLSGGLGAYLGRNTRQRELRSVEDALGRVYAIANEHALYDDACGIKITDEIRAYYKGEVEAVSVRRKQARKQLGN